MGKKKTPGEMDMEKDLIKLMNEIEKHDFKSVNELNDFVSNITGKKFDDLPESTDDKSRSLDLAFQAYEEPVSKGKKLIKEALRLDPNNAEAYNYLASIEKDVDKAMKLFEKAIKAGEKTLGKKFFQEEKGHFWGIIKTRPYMRAKAGLASCLEVKNETDKAIAIFEEMLELNPDDNQGIRYFLSTSLLGKNDLTKFKSFMNKFPKEDCAVWNYNNALYHFKKTGRSTKTEKALRKAYNGNKYVIDYILGFKEFPGELPEFIGIGDENEAIMYVCETLGIWNQSEDAFNWLFEFKQKRLKRN